MGVSIDVYSYIAEKTRYSRSEVKWKMLYITYSSVVCPHPESSSVEDQKKWCDKLIAKYFCE